MYGWRRRGGWTTFKELFYSCVLGERSLPAAAQWAAVACVFLVAPLFLVSMCWVALRRRERRRGAKVRSLQRER